MTATQKRGLRLLKPQNAGQTSVPPSRYLITDLGQSWSGPVIKRLDELVGLQPGWDGYDGVPVPFQNAYFAMQVLQACCRGDDPTPQIVPGGSGDLQIEWHLEKGDIELHIFGPNNVHAWYFDEHTGLDGEEASLTNDFTVVVRWIKNLTEPTSAPVAAAS